MAQKPLELCDDGIDRRLCDKTHWRTEDGRRVHTREEAATIYVHAYPDPLVAPDGVYGPFTPREVGYLTARDHAGRAHGE